MKRTLRNKPVGLIAFLLLLALMLGYLRNNWQAYNEQTTFQPVIGLFEAEQPASSEQPEGEITDERGHGSVEDVFLQARIDRNRSLSKQIHAWQAAIPVAVGENAVQDAADVLERAAFHQERASKQEEIEQLLRLIGFSDALVYLYADSAFVFIQADAMDYNEVSRIAEVVVKATGLPLQGITIRHIPTTQTSLSN